MEVLPIHPTFAEIIKGDVDGHPFHGNQYQDGNGHAQVHPSFSFGKEGSLEGARVDPNKIGEILDSQEYTKKLNEVIGTASKMLNYGTQEVSDFYPNNALTGGCLATAEALKQLFPNGEIKASITTSVRHINAAVESGYHPIVDHFVLSIGDGKFLDGRGVINEAQAANLTDYFTGQEPKPLDNGLYDNHLVEATPAMMDEKRPMIFSPPGAPEALAAFILQQAKSSTVSKGDIEGHPFHGNQYTLGMGGTTPDGRSYEKLEAKAKEIAKELGYGDYPKFAENLVRVAANSKTLADYAGVTESGRGHLKLANLVFDRIGNNEPPKVLSQSEFDKYRSKLPPLFTGISTHRSPAEDKIADFAYGKGVKIGAGAFGRAWYSTTNAENAQYYASSAHNGEVDGGVMKLKLQADSKVLDYNKAVKALNNAESKSADILKNIDAVAEMLSAGKPQLKDIAETAAQTIVAGDENIRLAMMGVDALTAKVEENGNSYVMILNRGKLVMSDTYDKVSPSGLESKPIPAEPSDVIKGESAGHPFRGNQWETGEGDSPISFIQRNIKEFYDAGGRITALSGYRTSAIQKVNDEITKLKKKEYESMPKRQQLGIDLMGAAVKDVKGKIYDEDPDIKECYLLVARDKDKNLAAVVSVSVKETEKYGNYVDVGYLGSTGKVPGAATAIEEQIAQIANDRGLPVQSKYIPDSKPYHQLLGRSLEPDNKWSKWNEEQARQIAALENPKARVLKGESEGHQFHGNQRTTGEARHANTSVMEEGVIGDLTKLFGKPDGRILGSMTQIDNEDWLKYNSWDLYRVGKLITTLPDLLWSLGVSNGTTTQQLDAVENFTHLPVWNAAPQTLKDEVSNFLKD